MTRSAANPNALVLPPDAATSSEAVTFPGFPGQWRPGNPVRLDTIGLDLMAARALIDELGLPLVELEHKKREEPAVPDANPPRHVGNQVFDPGQETPEPPAEAEDVAPPDDAPPATADTPGGAE